MLEELVSQGKLPPLKERLPRNPAVVQPVNEPGRYGGVWRRHTLGLDRAGMSRLIYDPALRWSADGTEIKPISAGSTRSPMTTGFSPFFFGKGCGGLTDIP